MRFSYKHGTGADTVRARLEELVPEMLTNVGSQVSEIEHRWDGDTMHFSFRALGRKNEGTAVVSAAEVVFDIGLPLMARPFEGQIKTRITQALDNALR